MRRSPSLAITAACLAAVLSFAAAGCGSDDEQSPDAPAAAAAAPQAPPATQARLATTQVALGTIVTDTAGRTLYAFDKDQRDISSCYDACAARWPALLTAGAPASDGGVDASLLGTTQRSDGTSQATYRGRPLYYFALDAAAGDTAGQGVMDVWHVVTQAGEPVR